MVKRFKSSGAVEPVTSSSKPSQQVLIMAVSKLYGICRLCMAVLDRDAIDCCRPENSEIRVNIDLLYNVQIHSSDEFTTKICGRCSDIVVVSTMQYIRVSDAQRNIQAAVRLQNEIQASSMKSNSIAGKKRKFSGYQRGPVAKRPCMPMEQDDTDSGFQSESSLQNSHPSSICGSTANISTLNTIGAAWNVDTNSSLLTNNTSQFTSPTMTSNVFQLEKDFNMKKWPTTNLSNINFGRNAFLMNRYQDQVTPLTPPQTPPPESESMCRMESEFSPQKTVPAIKLMKRLVVPPNGLNGSRIARTTHTLFNVANNLYKHSTTYSGKVKTSTMAELTRKFAQMKLSGLHGYKNDIWSRVLLSSGG